MSVENAGIEDSAETISTLIHQTVSLGVCSFCLSTDILEYHSSLLV